MPNTYTQLNIHVVFAVKGRENILTDNFRQDLFRYISGILTHTGQFALAVNGYKDHVHAFFELKPSATLSDIVCKIKANSSKWINDNKFVKGKFEWQGGYGAFSYSRSQRNAVINYIINQEQRHEKHTFKQEYTDLLKMFDIEYSNEYIFEFYE